MVFELYLPAISGSWTWARTKLQTGGIATAFIDNPDLFTEKVLVTSTDLAINAVTTPAIQDSAVTTSKIANAAVTSVKIATNAVASTNIADGAVTTTKIPDRSVTNPKIAVGAVGYWELADGAVQGTKIADATVSWQKFGTVGMVVDYAGWMDPSTGNGCPAGWLPCWGWAISRTAYSSLFNVLSTMYGGGDGVNTFNLPDCRGRSTIGAGQGPGLSNNYYVGQKYGAERVALSVNEMPYHNHGTSNDWHNHGLSDGGHAHWIPEHGHGVWDNGHSHSYVYPIGNFAGAAGSSQYSAAGNASTSASGSNHGVYNQGRFGTEGSGNGAGIYGSASNITINYAGASWSHENMHPVIAMHKIIKY
jgi:microcystin-dependent protein